MDKLKNIAIGGAAVLVIVGGIIYTQVDTLFPDNPQGPGSDDFYAKEEPTGPGSGQEAPEAEPQGPGSDDFYAKEEPTGPGSGQESNVIGSCDVIDGSSICTDYIGSYWATPDVIALNCQGVGIYSDKQCPQPNSGGCQNGADTNYETIVWYYPFGGEPITGELITYAAGTCGAVGGHYLFAN